LTSPDKQTAGLQGLANVVEENGTKGVSSVSARPTAVFCNPSERQRAKRIAFVKRSNFLFLV